MAYQKRFVQKLDALGEINDVGVGDGLIPTSRKRGNIAVARLCTNDAATGGKRHQVADLVVVDGTANAEPRDPNGLGEKSDIHVVPVVFFVQQSVAIDVGANRVRRAVLGDVIQIQRARWNASRERDADG